MHILFSPCKKFGQQELCKRIQSEYEKGESIVYIVPQQYTLEAELLLFHALKTQAMIRAQVKSFSSLAREISGKRLRPLGNLGKQLLVKQAMERPLTLYEKSKDRIGLQKRFIQSLDEFLDRGGNRAMLQQEIMESKDSLYRSKLEDFSAVLKSYEEGTEKYTENRDLMKNTLELLPQSEELSRTHFFISGFFTFSPMEQKLIEALDKYSASVMLLLPYSQEATDEKMPVNPFPLSEELYRVWDHEQANIHWLSGDNPRVQLMESLFSFQKVKPYIQDDIHLFEASTMEDEVEYVALTLTQKRREYGYGEMAVNIGNLEQYENTIKRIFKEYQIPFYIHKRKNIKETVLGRYFLLGMAVLSEGDMESTMAFLNLPSGEFFREQKGEFEKIVQAREVEGERLFDLDKSGKLQEVIGVTYRELRKSSTVRQKCTLLYEFFSQEIFLEALMQENEQDDFSQVWRLFMHLLEDIVRFLGEEYRTWEVLSRMIAEGMKDLTLVSLPAEGNQVMVSGMARSFTGAKVQFLLDVSYSGVEDVPQEEGIFTWRELEQTTLPFIKGETVRSLRQSNLFQLLCEGEELFVSMNLGGKTPKEPAWVFSRLKKVLPKTYQIFEFPEKFYHYNYSRVLESVKDSGENLDIFPRSREIVRELSGEGTLMGDSISATAMEEYARCPYRYFIHRQLRPEEMEDLELNPMDIGNIVHELLKKYTAIRREKGVVDREKLLEDHFNLWEERLHAHQKMTFKTAFFLENLRKESEFILKRIEEMLEELDFQPIFEEVYFGKNTPLKASISTAKNKYALEGYIDRVDRYESYAIVVDYKTGSKQFDLSKMYYGWDLQLVFYLLVLKNTLPTGAFYLPLKRKYGKTPAEETMRYSGFYYYDKDVLSALEKHKGSILDKKTVKNALSKEDMEGVLKYTERFLKDQLKALEEKRIAPEKKKLTSTTTSCDYCDYRSLCGYYEENNPFTFLDNKKKWEDFQ